VACGHSRRDTAGMSVQSRTRKRMKRREVPGDIRFVTFSCERRLPLLSNPAIADLYSGVMAAARARFGFELYAWVVMPEHVHMLVRPRVGAPLGPALAHIKKSVAQRVIARWRELDAPVLRSITRPDGSPRFWQKGGGFDRNVRDLEEFTREVRYIHRNPVDRELVPTPELWRWSSVRWWMGQRAGEVECDPPPGDARGWENWRGYL
jgi:putative transposase